MADEIRTRRVTPRASLGVALNQHPDVLRAFEDLQADVILLAAMLQAAKAEADALKARVHDLDGL